jgi:hypothetical protein
VWTLDTPPQEIVLDFMVKLDISIAFKDTRLLLFVGRYRSQELLAFHLPAI